MIGYTKESQKLVEFLKGNLSKELTNEDYQTIIYAAYEFGKDVRSKKKK